MNDKGRLDGMASATKAPFREAAAGDRNGWIAAIQRRTTDTDEESK